MRITLASPMRPVDVLADALGATVVDMGLPGGEIVGMATDSREIMPGDVFIAMRGKQHNGNDFIKHSLLRGAVAVISDDGGEKPTGSYRLFRVKNVESALLSAAAKWRSLSSATVVAISGSTGKTTVKEIVASVLSGAGTVRKSEGNFNSTVGVPLSLLGMENADFFVLEVGINHVGEMAAISHAISPHLAVLTNVGSAHVGNFGSHDILLAEKLKITVGQRAEDTLMLADSIPRSAYRGLPQRVLTVGTSEWADIRPENCRQGNDGVRADVCDRKRSVPGLFWHIPGSIGLSAISLGGAVGLFFGLEEDAIRAGLLRASMQAPRMKIQSILGLRVIDDTYNASPEAMVASLEALAYLGNGNTAAVFGDIGELGEMAELLHDAVGECAARSGIRYFFTYGNYAQALAGGAARGGLSPQCIHAFSKGREKELARLILNTVPDGTTVLFKASRKTALERVILELGREE